MAGGQVQRRVRIERIVVASIVTDFARKWPDVESCITSGMFTDQLCRRVFKTVERMAADGEDVNIRTVWERMGTFKTRAILLMDLTNGSDFNLLRWDYETSHRLARKPYRHVTFADYVTQLIRNHEQRPQTYNLRG